MSKYTTTIKVLIDNKFDFQLDEYPIFDEDHRDILNKKILDEYYMSEIGFETAALFRHYLKSKMNLIMPKYNTLYAEQAAAISNMSGNVNLTETFNEEKDGTFNTDTSGTSNGTNSGSTTGKNLFEDTPQGSLDTVAINTTSYATNVNQSQSTTSNTDSTSNSGSSDTTTDENRHYSKTIVGNNGKTYRIDNYEKLKAAYVNIDEAIVKDLADLFMGVF